MYQFEDVLIEFVNHDCFRITWKGKVIYTDPFEVGERPTKGDIITVSHDHFDHLSLEDIRKVSTENTVILASKNCEGKLKGVKVAKIEYLKPGEASTVQGIEFSAVPSYNLTKFRAPGQPFHPKEYGGVGWIITLQEHKIYHAGDTDNIPDIVGFGDIDVALLPVSGKYVMTVDEAVEMVKMLKPKVAIPMHIGSIVGSFADANSFKDKASKYCEVIILRPES